MPTARNQQASAPIPTTKVTLWFSCPGTHLSRSELTLHPIIINRAALGDCTIRRNFFVLFLTLFKVHQGPPPQGHGRPLPGVVLVLCLLWKTLLTFSLVCRPLDHAATVLASQDFHYDVFVNLHTVNTS